MAKYTIELRKIVESGYNIFNFPYNFYDEEKKVEFEKNFIRHFYFREIGCESVERFKLYLEDKMKTVFPYYNELFKSALIKYDVLDNYKLTETFTRNAENEQNQNQFSSSVGQIFDKQNVDTTNEKTTDTTGNANTTNTGTENETGNANKNLSSSSKNKTTGTTANESEEKKRFLDTPQGLVDLTSEEYLTTLNHDTMTGNGTTNGTNDTDTTETEESESERNVSRNDSSNTSTTGKEETQATTKTVSDGEQKTTNDNNTRHYLHRENKEEYTLVRRGNIGVDTDSDAITKHNKLQRTLKTIEINFFDECEDLFMQVF